MPFGIGNRLCIGSRLALMEMKLSIITALKKFEFKTCPDTPVSFTNYTFMYACCLFIT